MRYLIGMHLDLRRTLRRLWRSPSYPVTVVGLLTATLAVTGTTFALADGVLFRKLPFAVPQHLHLLRADSSAEPFARPPAIAGRLVAAFEEAAPDLPLTAIDVWPRLFLKLDGRSIFMAGIDEHFFDVLGTRPLLGGFTADDFEDAGELQPAIISYRLWRVMFGQDETIVGRDVVLVETAQSKGGIRVAGVLGPDFVFPLEAQEASPDVLTPRPRRHTRKDPRRASQFIVRAPSREAVPAIAERLRVAMLEADPQQAPGQNPRLDRVELLPLNEYLGSGLRPALQFVIGGAAVLLLLVCLNLAALATAREIDRGREVTTERMLGAGRWRFVRGLSLELFILVTAAAALSAALMPWLLQWSMAFLPTDVELLRLPAIDGRAIAAVLAIGTLAVVTIGGVAMWTVRRWSYAHTGRSVSPRAFERPVLAAQAAFGAVLIAVGMLSGASVLDAWGRDAAFDRSRIAVVEVLVTKHLDRLDSERRLRAAFDAVSRTPGVRATAAADPGLLDEGEQPPSRLVPVGVTEPIEGVRVRWVTHEFFLLARMRLTDGGWPTLDQWHDPPAVALVSERAAQTLWPGAPAVGQTLVPLKAGGRASGPVMVVGVVADHRYERLDTEPHGTIFVPFPLVGVVGAVLLAETGGRSADVVPAIAAAVGRIDGIRLARAATAEHVLFASLRHRVFPAWLFGWFGVLAMGIVASGIAGMVGMSIARSRPEIGIRLALGATPRTVIAALVREKVRVVWAGVAVGFLLSWWLGRYLEAHLHGMSPVQPSIWILLAALVTAVTIAATLLPALKVSTFDPSQLLKET
jgi:putative ABC transport system permease protein